MVAAAERGFSADALTIGFARRLATYKRLYLLTLEPHRVAELIANLAAPDADDPRRARRTPTTRRASARRRGCSASRSSPTPPSGSPSSTTTTWASPPQLVAGCDLWVNLPRPPLEASGTSGMKAVLNGGLNLSVLDGWWAEAYDGANGWAISGDAVLRPQRAGHARRRRPLRPARARGGAALLRPATRDGVPHGWVRRIKRSLRTNGPRFSATRMVRGLHRQRLPPAHAGDG